jgi:hypothetical protein
MMRHAPATLIAMIAIAATASVTTAPASAEEGFLPTTTFTGKGGAAKLQALSKLEIACTSKLILEGTMETDSHGRIFSIHFNLCKTLGLPANSLGDEKEVILVTLLTWLLCLINSATLEFGLYLEVPAVHIEVPSLAALVEVSGTLIGKITPNTKGKERTVTFAQKEGDPTVKECKNEKGEVKKAELKTLEGGETVKSSSGLDATDTLTTAAETELMDK